MMTLLCPHGDSNSGLSLERAPSWATRRWGHLASLTHVSDMVCSSAKLTKPSGQDCILHASFLFSEACGIVSFQSLIVNKCTHSPVHKKDVYLARSMHADRVGHFNVAGSGWAGYEHCRSGCAHHWQGQCI